jgi:hypothetical protein
MATAVTFRQHLFLHPNDSSSSYSLIQTPQSTQGRLPPCTPRMRRTGDDDFETSLDSLSTEIIFLVAEHTIRDAHALFESELNYRHCVPLQCSLKLPLFKTPAAYAQTLTNIQQTRGISPQITLPPLSEIGTIQDKYTFGATGLLSLALTNRRYWPIAQEVLYHTPLLRSDLPWTETAPIFLLARTLLSSPYLARHINKLRFDMPEYWTNNIVPSTTANAIVTQAQTFIDGVNWTDQERKKEWTWQLQKLRQLPFLALILSLSPNMKSFCLTNGNKNRKEFEDDLLSRIFWSTSAGSMEETDHAQAMERLASCPGLAGLRHLRKALELYAGSADTEDVLAEATPDQQHAINYKQDDTLFDHLYAVSSTLKRLELPRE